MARPALVLAMAMAAALLAACGDENAPKTPETQYRLVLDTRELMNWVLDPSADVIWGSAGSIVTEEGEQDLAPVDAEGWTKVRHAAAVLIEGGNLLMMPGRTRGADWDEFARGMTTMAERAMSAAEEEDADVLFEVGGQLYNVCVACHQHYVLPQGQVAGP